MMTWEETIKYIRTQPQYANLVKFAYFEEQLALNITRFQEGPEYKATKKIIEKYSNIKKPTILEIGAGNGIASISFAKDGYYVHALEPDPSATIGAGAIKLLKQEYNLINIDIIEAYAEEIPLSTGSVDIVYARQAMHHAHNLEQFIKECTRVLKPHGLLITTRDHVVDNEAQKKQFLKNHPLQSFYGGENAFSVKEYSQAMTTAGLKIIDIVKPVDSVINRFPATDAHFFRRLGFLSNNKTLQNIYISLTNFKRRNVPGRLYSFVAIKK